MTLKGRNHLVSIFFIISFLTLLAMTTLYVFAFIKGTLVSLENSVRPFNIFPEVFLFAQNFYVPLIACAFFLLYVPLVLLALKIGFEKTQSTELIYFLFFLAACFVELFRLFIPLNGLWKTNSPLLSFSARLILAARFLAPLSFFFASIFYETDQRQNLERNIIAMIMLSICTSLFMPLKTLTFFSTNIVMWGHERLFFFVCIAVECATLIIILLNTYSKSMDELKPNAAGFILIAAGYSFLIIADNFVFLALGIIFLSLGTILYLNSIHRMYMWR
jgi:hypothetical protein